VRPIYKGYLVYAPGHEPPGYFDWLQQQEPVILWDDRGHAPPLANEADWIHAGEIAFDAARVTNTNITVEDVRDSTWLEKTGAPVRGDGTLPAVQYVIRSKGVVELGALSCGYCHTRVMPDGSVIKGAQGNFPALGRFECSTGAARPVGGGGPTVRGR
jgi:hypothetical protein